MRRLLQRHFILLLAFCFCQLALIAQEQKTLSMPYIEGLENMDLKTLDLTMECSGSKFQVSTLNWPKAFPYAPDCNGIIAYSDSSIAVLFHVRGMDLRAVNTQDNGPVYQDSCQEVFILGQDGQKYYNFEVNCIGTLHAAYGINVRERDPFPMEKMQRIKRLTSLERGVPIDISDEVCSYSVALIIPMEIIGIDPQGPVPEYLLCNFYKCADKSAHPHYISWNPIDSPKPNFHQPQFFSKVYFERKSGLDE